MSSTEQERPYDGILRQMWEHNRKIRATVEKMRDIDPDAFAATAASLDASDAWLIESYQNDPEMNEWLRRVIPEEAARIDQLIASSTAPR